MQLAFDGLELVPFVAFSQVGHFETALIAQPTPSPWPDVRSWCGSTSPVRAFWPGSVLPPLCALRLSPLLAVFFKLFDSYFFFDLFFVPIPHPSSQPPAGLLSLTKDLLSAPTAIPNRLVFSLNLDSRNLEFESLCRLLLSWYQGLELQVSTSLRPPAPRPSVDVILHSDPAKLKRAVLQHLPELGLVVDVADSAEGLRATEQWLEGVNDLRSPLPPAGLRSLLLPTALPLDPEIPIAEGTENTQDDDEKQNESQPMLPQFEETVLGGTFDRLHAGHKLLLQTTAYLARRVLWVGVSAGPLLTKKRHGWSLQGWPRRAAGVHSFVGLCRPNLKVRCEELFDSYGPSLHPTVEALVVSKETEAGGPLVNRKRAELGRSPLELFVIPLARSASSLLPPPPPLLVQHTG